MSSKNKWKKFFFCLNRSFLCVLLASLTVAAVQAGLGAHLDFLLQVLCDEVGQVSFMADRSLELQSRGDRGPSSFRLAGSAATPGPWTTCGKYTKTNPIKYSMLVTNDLLIDGILSKVKSLFLSIHCFTESFSVQVWIQIKLGQQRDRKKTWTMNTKQDWYLLPHAWLISSRLLLSCIPRTFRTQTWAMTWGGQVTSSEGKGVGGGDEEVEVLGQGADEE